MDCKVAVAWMHDYLDGDLDRRQAESLKQHMNECAECRQRFDALARTEALVKAIPSKQAPAGLEERILASLPKTRRPAGWSGWVRRHPAMSAAALFLVVMLSSFVAMWNQDRQLSVSGPDLDNVIIEGTTVIVPEGQEVSGDLTVANGTAEVHGDVKGDLTVIDGNVTLASTAHIAGHVQEIDRVFDWAWYKVRSWFGTLAYGS
ncbi:anti-sigma factor [Cohnella sp. CFH 77786]|uniref:zf-HC2 domain-containing protein n=1 Tax=Cohnella sp. CFH 77786 TaxID=2662265 RepID=UPI001C60E92E|nr:zf-HC2 domain-containing protein [Cohnella sp. CFH 77786]MBW5448206.1 anti-sigma factor [Cohnella sp. CFH 77786]